MTIAHLWEEHNYPGEWVLMDDYPIGIALAFIVAIDAQSFRWYVFMDNRQFATGQRFSLNSAQQAVYVQMVAESQRWSDDSAPHGGAAQEDE